MPYEEEAALAHYLNAGIREGRDCSCTDIHEETNQADESESLPGGPINGVGAALKNLYDRDDHGDDHGYLIATMVGLVIFVLAAAIKVTRRRVVYTNVRDSLEPPSDLDLRVSYKDDFSFQECYGDGAIDEEGYKEGEMI